MRTIIYIVACIGIWLAISVAGCGSDGGTDSSSSEGKDSGSGGSGEDGGGGTGGTDAGDEEAGETGGGAVDGPYECINANTSKRKSTGAEFSCGLERCIPGTGCKFLCESDDDCVTAEEVGLDPCEPIYCELESGWCGPRVNMEGCGEVDSEGP